MIPHIGINVHETPLLPVDITYDACDIDIKSEIKILSGEQIHCLTFNNEIFLSPQMYKELLKLPTIKI